MNVVPVDIAALGAVVPLEKHLGILDIKKKEADGVQFPALYWAWLTY